MMTSLSRWIAALTVAISMGVASTSAQANPPTCQLVKVADLPIKFENNQPLIQVMINGEPTWFLIDTGADESLMFGGAADALHLNQYTASGMRIYGVGGGQDVKSTTISDLRLSEVDIKDLRLSVVGYKGLPGETGIIGRDVLSHFDIEFDLANNQVRLFQSKGCRDQSLAYWSHQPEVTSLNIGLRGEFLVGLKINGHSVDAIIDSGDSLSVVTPDVVGFRHIKKEKAPADAYSWGIGETKVNFEIGTFDKVSIGSENISNAKLQVSDLFHDDTEIASDTGGLIPKRIEGLPSMLLGADFLRSHRVLLALDQHRMYFTYSGGPVFQSVGPAVTPGETAAATVPTAGTPASAAPVQPAIPAAPAH